MKQYRRRSALANSNTSLVSQQESPVKASPPPSESFRLKVPNGWRVKEVIRADGSRSDLYYVEPETGRKFRSIKEIHRYLNGEEWSDSPRSFRNRNLSIYNNHDCGCRKMVLSSPEATNSETRRLIVSGGKLLRIDEESSHRHLPDVESLEEAPEAPEILPDGWIVEEVPRRYHPHFADKYYLEPGTGQKFRSLVAVQRYFEEENEPLSKALQEMKEKKPLSKLYKLEYHHHPKNDSPELKKTITEFAARESSSILPPPPREVNWILGSSADNEWNPFIKETKISETVKQKWTQCFMNLMNQ